MSDSVWPIFRGTGEPHEGMKDLPAAPPWRSFHGEPVERRLMPATKRARFQIEPEEIELVNAALFLRRPLLITGKPGTGKSSLAHAVAYELGLGPVLVWPINTRSTLQEGLYRYDAVSRLQDSARDKESTALRDIGRYIKLGPLGTALIPTRRPRVLLIDEIDKSDIDFPNDLLHVFEEGTFEIPELSRLPKEHEVVDVQPFDGDEPIPIKRGRVTAAEFPFVVMTSNGERDFPAPFLRRCIRLEMKPPGPEKLAKIVTAHFNETTAQSASELIAEFVKRRESADLATDQLLNTVYLVTRHRVDLKGKPREALKEALLRELK